MHDTIAILLLLSSVWEPLTSRSLGGIKIQIQMRLTRKKASGKSTTAPRFYERRQKGGQDSERKPAETGWARKTLEEPREECLEKRRSSTLEDCDRHEGHHNGIWALTPNWSEFRSEEGRKRRLCSRC